MFRIPTIFDVHNTVRGRDAAGRAYVRTQNVLACDVRNVTHNVVLSHCYRSVVFARRHVKSVDRLARVHINQNCVFGLGVKLLVYGVEETWGTDHIPRYRSEVLYSKF